MNETRPGALPFRVWQIYTAMVKSLKQAEPDVVGFLCAAGCLAHYVGDACQPLHISRLHHGQPPVKSGSVAYNVHPAYETDVLNEHASKEIVKGVSARLKGVKVKPTFQGGKGAAMRVIQLMAWTVKNIPPKDLVDTYNAGTSPADRINRSGTPSARRRWTAWPRAANASARFGRARGPRAAARTSPTRSWGR